MKKEFLVYLGVFIVLSTSIHFTQWSTDAVQHLQSLPNSSAYGLGWEHPFIFSAVLYAIIYLVRLPFGMKKNKDLPEEA